MTNIPRILHEGCVYKKKRRESGFKLLIVSGQKSTAWMKVLVQMFTKPENRVDNACNGTFSVAKSCTLLPKQRMFIKCLVDSSCATEAMSQLILLYTQQVFSKESDIDEKKSSQFRNDVG